MTLSTFSAFCRGLVSVAAASLLEGLLLASVALAEPKLLSELEVNRDYWGPIQQIAFDASGHAWMATPKVLYEVRDGKPNSVVDVALANDAQLLLAPGGGLYARLEHGAAALGLFTVQLFAIPKKPLAELRLEQPPFGFGALYLGGSGQLIVTATPVDNSEGLKGEFLYVFWSNKGEALFKIRLTGPRIGVVDAAGSALLLLGESDAIAFSKTGKQLWKLDGSFRKGALAIDGTVALLNPAQSDAVHKVAIYRGGTLTTTEMPSAVHELALAADGSDGAVAVDQGDLYFVAPQSCAPGPCELRKVSRLPVDGTFFITAIRFIDTTTIGIGVIQRAGKAPAFTFPAGAVLAATATTGKVVFKQSIALEGPASWAPLIDVTFGNRFFAAHSPRKALFFRLDP